MHSSCAPGAPSAMGSLSLGAWLTVCDGECVTGLLGAFLGCAQDAFHHPSVARKVHCALDPPKQLPLVELITLTGYPPPGKSSPQEPPSQVSPCQALLWASVRGRHGGRTQARGPLQCGASKGWASLALASTTPRGLQGGPLRVHARASRRGFLRYTALPRALPLSRSVVSQE